MPDWTIQQSVRCEDLAHDYGYNARRYALGVDDAIKSGDIKRAAENSEAAAAEYRGAARQVKERRLLEDCPNEQIRSRIRKIIQGYERAAEYYEKIMADIAKDLPNIGKIFGINH